MVQQNVCEGTNKMELLSNGLISQMKTDIFP